MTPLSFHELALNPTCFCCRYVIVTITTIVIIIIVIIIVVVIIDTMMMMMMMMIIIIHSFILIALHPCIGGGDQNLFLSHCLIDSSFSKDCSFLL